MFEGSRHCICKEVDSLGVYMPNFQDELNYSMKENDK